jgi:hypothetical protein
MKGQQGSNYRLKHFICFSDFNTSLNWWMETAAAGGRAMPEHGNVTGFNRWLFTDDKSLSLLYATTDRS